MDTFRAVIEKDFFWAAVDETDVRSIDFDEERGLDRLLITELATCGFAERGQNVVVQGPAVTGKTYLACAIAKASRTTLRCAAFQVLVPGEWLLDRPDELFRALLLELMEAH